MLVNGMYSDNFLLWCRKTERLTSDEFRVGFDELERQKIAAAGNGRNVYAPDYATFIGLAKMKKVRIDPTEDPTHPNYIEPKDPLLLEQPGRKERVNKTGNDALKSIKDMF